MALSVDPDGLDPQRTTAASTFQITNNIYEPLLTVTPEGELTSALADSWTVSEDGLTITFIPPRRRPVFQRQSLRRRCGCGLF